MKLNRWLRYFIAVLLCGWFVGLYWYTRPAPQVVKETSCHIVQQQCQLVWGGQRNVTLKLLGTPSPLNPFVVEVEGLDVPALSISFAMADMEMGSNTFVLKSIGVGRWRGRVVLPVCIQRRHDWRITLFNQQHAIVITTSLPSGSVQ